MGIFILIKRKGSKNYLGAIPVKKGVSKLQAQKLARKTVKKAFSFRIATGNEVKAVLRRMTLKKVRTKLKRTPKRKTRRKKRR